MSEKGLTKNKILSELMRSTHGKLDEYMPVGMEAAKTESEFTAHLIAYNHVNGQIRDSKIALPVITLACPEFPGDLVENSLAHLATLDPRNFVRALRFALGKTKGRGRMVRNLVEQYLRAKESHFFTKWERAAVQHRRSMKELYALFHVKPSAMANDILFKREYPKGSVFETIARLKDMSPTEAAAAILDRKIPYLIAVGAMGKKADDQDVTLAFINRMSATELITNSKMLNKRGIQTVPALRAAYNEALEKAGASTKATFKTTRAADVIEDETIKAKLQATQERQIKALGGIEGRWAVLADKSGSMTQAIEVARQVAGTLAKMVKQEVYLIFFDTVPRFMDVTGKTYEQILEATKRILAQGGTSIGCGLQYLMDKNEEVDGIAVVSDCAENTPPYFADRYGKYCESLGKSIPVYVYRCDAGMTSPSDTELSVSMKSAGHDLQEFDLRGSKVDFYSLPGLVKSMNTSRYSLIDTIMETRLLTINEVLGARQVTTHA